MCGMVERERRTWRKRRGAGALFLCRRWHCKDARPLLTHPSPVDPPTSLLHYDITHCRPSQPRLVGSDERVSQLVPRSHVIRGDVAASAAGWAGALHSLIRCLKGGGEGMSVCMCLRVCALCVCVSVCAPVFCAHMAANPQNMAVGQSVLPIATRHLTPRMVDPDSVVGAKLGLVGGSGDGGGIGCTG